jgi:hypothetical protein
MRATCPALLVIGFFIGAPALAEQKSTSFLCTAESSTGFAFKDGAWRETAFAAEQFLVKPTTAEQIKNENWNSTDLFALYKLGESDFAFPCGAWIFDNEPLQINCTGFYAFKFNLRPGRFVAAYMNGYIDGIDGPGATPVIMIGKCVSLPE